MTDRQIVIRTAQIKGFDLIKPSKADKTILVMDWSTGRGKVAAEAKTWADARQQLAQLNRA